MPPYKSYVIFTQNLFVTIIVKQGSALHEFKALALKRLAQGHPHENTHGIPVRLKPGALKRLAQVHSDEKNPEDLVLLEF